MSTHETSHRIFNIYFIIFDNLPNGTRQGNAFCRDIFFFTDMESHSYWKIHKMIFIHLSTATVERRGRLIPW